MRKSSVVGVIGAVTVAATASYLLLDKPIRKINNKKYSNPNRQNQASLPIEAAIDPGEELENANMIAEGSQFSVNYYDKMKE
ncbi:hypothetical protein SH601_02730 [Gracilibacillus sp. S3-1-1]|uniref:Uncharacterized protein n=1 Tax=Gracilibacillus pellucidus TaxID=3095368 RepID=A0ACC6M1S6_9BACI|nr:hypothetical protein [Gracilibacillus sp. S3-1-1]MDX8044891.1 hypothetical protein [Gracilibacillus sp. S3-1-1]